MGEPGVGCLQPPGRRGLSKNKAQPSIPSVMRGGMEVAVCFLTPAVWAQRHPPPILHQSSTNPPALPLLSHLYILVGVKLHLLQKQLSRIFEKWEEGGPGSHPSVAQHTVLQWCTSDCSVGPSCSLRSKTTAHSWLNHSTTGYLQSKSELQFCTTVQREHPILTSTTHCAIFLFFAPQNVQTELPVSERRKTIFPPW